MSKPLIVYFSQSGNTAKLAKMIQAETDGTLFDIATGEVDVSAYDTVFVGTPNWSASVAAPVKEYLTKTDLSGKTVIPFCTHGMGGLQNVASDMAKLCPNSKVLQSFAIKGVEVDSAPLKVKAWLVDIGVK
jgi:flavodoxin